MAVLVLVTPWLHFSTVGQKKMHHPSLFGSGTALHTCLQMTSEHMYDVITQRNKGLGLAATPGFKVDVNVCLLAVSHQVHE